MSETQYGVTEDVPLESVWIDPGDPDCDGEPHWTQDKNGKRTFTCPKCSLHWYYVIPRVTST